MEKKLIKWDIFFAITELGLSVLNPYYFGMAHVLNAACTGQHQKTFKSFFFRLYSNFAQTHSCVRACERWHFFHCKFIRMSRCDYAVEIVILF